MLYKNNVAASIRAIKKANNFFYLKKNIYTTHELTKKNINYIGSKLKSLYFFIIKKDFFKFS